MRPTKYTQEIADRICELVATTNKAMRTICEEVGIDYTTHLNWVKTNQEYFNSYAHAKEAQADFMAEEMLEIADQALDPAKARVQIDTRKWLASKLRPKKYGDKLDVDHTTKGEAIQAPTINILPKSDDK